MSKFRHLVLNALKESIIKCDILPTDSNSSYIDTNNDTINVLKNPYNDQEIINFLKNNTKTGEARVFDIGPDTYYADANVLTHWHLLDILKYNDIVDEQSVYKNNGEIALSDYENDDLSTLNLSDLYFDYISLHNNPDFYKDYKDANEKGLNLLHYIYSDEDLINTSDNYDTFINKYKNLLNKAKEAWKYVTEPDKVTPEIEKLCNFYYDYIIKPKINKK